MTKKYKLLKDLPTFKAGDEFFLSNKGNLVAGTPENPETITTNIYGVDRPVDLIAYSQKTLEEFPDILTEWFEEVKESTDSIHWEPKRGDKCFILENANIRPTVYTAMLRDYNAWRVGRVFRTEEECEKARDRELAEVRLRRTSTFTPDFENGRGGWFVAYNHLEGKLEYFQCSWQDAGESVRYETREDAEKSIKENEREWKIYFGIEEGEK
jgi:hypothetical protein|nr:MAG TPA: hypothetical protein [Caudoviricetes sp.]